MIFVVVTDADKLCGKLIIVAVKSFVVYKILHRAHLSKHTNLKPNYKK